MAVRNRVCAATSNGVTAAHAAVNSRTCDFAALLLDDDAEHLPRFRHHGAQHNDGSALHHLRAAAAFV